MIGSYSKLRRAVVVVPVHDEELLLDSCLSSIADAADRVDVETQLVVVLDACFDSSADTAAVWADKIDAMVVTVDRRNVGAARAAGFGAADALGALHGVDTWFATTDADSVVPPNWLSSQLDHARRGARALAGTVVPDFGASPPASTAAYDANYRHRPGHRHVHGANLGMRADDYWYVGGFAALETGEDVDLIRRFEHSAVPVRYVCDAPVSTSARSVGRAPNGFADHLRSLDLAVAL